MNTIINQSNISIKQVETSRLPEIDFSKIPFGRVFSDHMFRADYDKGSWNEARILPYGPMLFQPSLMALHYGQSIFEGLKAYRAKDQSIRVFRPQENFKRLNKSAERMSMAPVPESIFMDGLTELIKLDKGWVPDEEFGSLYIRPFYFASDEFIGVQSSQSYQFVIFTCPVGPYYTKPVSLLVNRDFVRAAPGGTGAAKTAGNYAAALLPDKLAKAKGYDNILWLDAKELTYIEECGTMNVFFVLDDVVITPPLTGTILPGITRASVIQLLKDNGVKVEERLITIEEVASAYKEGSLKEAFGAGTAATISHIAKIGYEGKDMILPSIEEREVGSWLASRLQQIKVGEIEDPYNWITTIE